MKDTFSKIFKSDKKGSLSKESIAKHEAAHGIIFFMFRDNWKLKKLTIQEDEVPEEDMDGGLHISLLFEESQMNRDRANELCTIAYAGYIGQNIDKLKWVDVSKLLTLKDIYSLFDSKGTSGDMEIILENLPKLASAYMITEEQYQLRILLELIDLFAQNSIIQNAHQKLSYSLLDNGTLTSKEVIDLLIKEGLDTYIIKEDLGEYFFFQRM